MIRISDCAAIRIKETLSKRGKGIGIRLGTKATGCSGLAYILEFVDVVNDDDLVFEDHGAKVVVSRKDLVYLDGMTLDYTQKGLSEGFDFQNPNVTGECGCGESFTV